MNARRFLPCALIPMLTCLPSCKTVEPVFVPPKIDCAAYEPPKVETPAEPKLGEKDPFVWQLYAYAWQGIAEHVLGQRVETASCLKKLEWQGVIK